MQHLHSEVREVSPPEVSSAELVKEAMAEATRLLRLEIELAKDEARTEALAAKKAGIVFGIGAGVLIVGVSLLFVALGLAIFPGPVPSLVLGLGLLALSTIACVAGVRLMPKKPLSETRRRIETDIETVKEHVV